MNLLSYEPVFLDDFNDKFVILSRFELDPATPDREALDRLCRSPGYACEYLGQHGMPKDPSDTPTVHGKWRLDEISAEIFESTDAITVRRIIQQWADETDGQAPLSAAAQTRLEVGVFPLLDLGRIYRLGEMSTAAEHEMSWSVGMGGFYEFEVMDRAAGQLHVIVATDD